MDPFEKLPYEINLNILLHADTRKDLALMSHASPVLFRQRRGSTTAIHAHLLRKELHDVYSSDLLQDAMAILLFPEKADGQDEQSHMEQVRHHLKLWGAKKLPDPIQQRDLFTMNRLEALCTQVQRHSNDFLWKATSSDLRRAYVQLPEWSHPEQTNVHNLPPRPEDRQVQLDSLSATERQRILKSFMKFEILSRLFRLHSQRRDDAMATRAEPMEHPAAYPAWSWDHLDQYEHKMSARWEIEGIRCVFEYVRCLYGALSARFIGLPPGFATGRNPRPNPDAHLLPPTLSDTRNRSSLAEFFFKEFNRPNKWWNWKIRPSFSTFIDQLSLGGLDQVDKLLNHKRDYVEKFFIKAAEKEAKNGSRTSLRRFEFNCPWNKTDWNGPGVWGRLNPQELYDSVHEFRKFYKELLCTYRQRGWVFFDDERLYPGSCSFPSISDMVVRDMVRAERNRPEIPIVSQKQEPVEELWRRWAREQGAIVAFEKLNSPAPPPSTLPETKGRGEGYWEIIL